MPKDKNIPVPDADEIEAQFANQSTWDQLEQEAIATAKQAAKPIDLDTFYAVIGKHSENTGFHEACRESKTFPSAVIKFAEQEDLLPVLRDSFINHQFYVLGLLMPTGTTLAPAAATHLIKQYEEFVNQLDTEDDSDVIDFNLPPIDKLEKFSDIPRIVVISRENPVKFFHDVLEYPVNAAIFLKQRDSYVV